MAYDCLLSDVNLPGMNGVEFLRRVRLTDHDVAVIMITGSPGLDRALDAMRLGAYDHLAKPLNLAKLTLTVDRAVEKRRLVFQNREYQLNLESMVLERTKQLNDANEGLRRLFVSSIKSLAHALEAKDEYTQGHSERVAEEAVTIARYLSLAQTEIENIWIAGLPPRHREDRDPRERAQQAGQARRRGVGDRPAAPRARGTDPRPDRRAA